MHNMENMSLEDDKNRLKGSSNVCLGIVFKKMASGLRKKLLQGLEPFFDESWWVDKL